MCTSQVLSDDVLCAVVVFIDRYSISYMSNQVRLLFFPSTPALFLAFGEFLSKGLFSRRGKISATRPS